MYAVEMNPGFFCVLNYTIFSETIEENYNRKFTKKCSCNEDLSELIMIVKLQLNWFIIE